MGKRFFEGCERVVVQANLAHEVLRDTVEQAQGHVRVTMPVDFGLIHVAPLIDEFARLYPKINMDLELSARSADFLLDRVDVALRLGPVGQDTLIARHLGHMNRVLYASPAYLYEHGVPATPLSLSTHECILTSNQNPPNRWNLCNQDQSMDVEVRGRFTSNSLSMMLSLAKQGHGIAALAPLVARAAQDEGLLEPVLEQWGFKPIAIHAVTASRLIPATTRLFIDFMASRLTI